MGRRKARPTFFPNPGKLLRATAVSKQAARAARKAPDLAYLPPKPPRSVSTAGIPPRWGSPSVTPAPAPACSRIRRLERERGPLGGGRRGEERKRLLFPTRGNNPCADSGCWEPPFQAALSSLGEGGTCVATPERTHSPGGRAFGAGLRAWRRFGRTGSGVFPPKERRA